MAGDHADRDRLIAVIADRCDRDRCDRLIAVIVDRCDRLIAVIADRCDLIAVT